MNHTHNETGFKDCPACQAEAAAVERAEEKRAGQPAEVPDENH